MKLSNSFSQKNEKKDPEFYKEYLAKTSALWSKNPFVSLRLNISRPYEAIAAIYVSTYYWWWQTDILLRTLAHRAYSCCYQGKWQLVQEILELQNQTPESLELWFIDQGLANEFFGNILPLSVKVERLINYKLNDPDKEWEILFNRPKTTRIRGYRDKGSCRLPHEHHGIPPYSEEREDRRSLVQITPYFSSRGQETKLDPEFQKWSDNASEWKEVQLYADTEDNNVSIPSPSFETEIEKNSTGEFTSI